MLLLGCSNVLKQPPVIVQAPKIICISPPIVDPVLYREVEYVMYIANGEHYVGTTMRDYEKLGLMMQEVAVHIEQKNRIIEYYKECLKAPE